jgi:hypothetical protein
VTLHEPRAIMFCLQILDRMINRGSNWIQEFSPKEFMVGGELAARKKK